MTPPVIKDNAVIGGGVTILPDVTVGEKAVIGGGSVVTKKRTSQNSLNGRSSTSNNDVRGI